MSCARKVRWQQCCVGVFSPVDSGPGLVPLRRRREVSSSCLAVSLMIMIIDKSDHEKPTSTYVRMYMPYPVDRYIMGGYVR